MNLKILKILGAIIAFLIAFPLHFLYDKFPNFLTSIIAPVNESIFEHMKIIFGSILFSGVIQKILVIKNDLKYNNICISNVISGLLSIFIFLAIFLPIYNIIGENFIVTIIIMFITFIISQIITIYIINKKDMKLENIAIILTILVYVIFGILTYLPINNTLFIDPITKQLGI